LLRATKNTIAMPFRPGQSGNANGRPKGVFDDEIGPDTVLASACLPFLFQAIEIDSEHYWDGGYMGNPAIFPLIYNCDSRDVVVVHINPIERPDVPKTHPVETVIAASEIFAIVVLPLKHVNLARRCARRGPPQGQTGDFFNQSASAWLTHREKMPIGRARNVNRRSMQASSFSCAAGNKTAPRESPFLFPLCGTSVRGRMSLALTLSSLS
jgi:predicted acylesterase/phospholipase RssA